MGELAEGLPPQLQEETQPGDIPREKTAPHDLGVRLRIQLELIAELYGLPPADTIENEFFDRWVDAGHAEWFNNFIHNDSETVALLHASNIEGAKIKIRKAFSNRNSENH